MTTSRRLFYASTLAAASLALTGCSTAMPSASVPEHPGSPRESAGAEWPLKFKAHYFSVFTYSTYGCQVIYNGRPRLDEPDNVLQIASSAVKQYPDNLSASWGPIGNFPAPAKVTWRSKDGSPHEAEIDFNEIFKDRLIRHNVARDDATDIATDGTPGIILEVNDRTINVYMRAMIWLRKPRFPDRPQSNYQNDLIKVFSHTY